MSEIRTGPRRLEKLLDFLILLAILVQPTQLGFNTKQSLTRAAEALHLAAPQPAPGTIAVTAPSGKTETTATAPAPPTTPPTALQKILDRVPSANFTIADVLLWILLLLWILKVLAYREFKEVRLWPLSILALVILAGLSMVQAWKPTGVTVDMSEAIKEMIQYVEYFIVGYVVFVNAAGREYMFRRMALTFWAATTIVILMAITQYMNLPGIPWPLRTALGASDDPMSVKALFGDRNVLGAYLALAVPFMWGVVLCEKNWLIKIWLAVATCGGLLVTLSGGAMAAILLGVLSISLLRSQKVFVPVLVAVFLAGLFLWPLLPRKNLDVLRDSVLLYKPVKEGEGWPWQQRYVEWQPAFQAMEHSPIVGVGVGNYQRHINQFYGEISKPGGRNYMEPNAINGYAILGVTAGVPALLALLWIVWDFRKRAYTAFAAFLDGIERGCALGIYGSLTGFVVVMFFTNVFVRGVGISFVILLALGAVLGRLAIPPAKPEEGEEKK